MFIILYLVRIFRLWDVGDKAFLFPIEVDKYKSNQNEDTRDSYIKQHL